MLPCRSRPTSRARRDPRRFEGLAPKRSDGPRPAGFTLIELLMTITLMAVLVALALPSSTPGIHDQLQSAAQIMAGDLAYARSLAVSYGSRARVRFDLAANRYLLELLDAGGTPQPLPDSPFRSPGGSSTQQIVDFDDLPRMGNPVRLWKATCDGSGVVTDLEFGPLGGTTQSGATHLWLSAAQGTAQRYLEICIDPITGLAEIGSFTSQSP